MRNCKRRLARDGDFSKEASHAIEHHPRALAPWGREIKAARLVGMHYVAMLGAQVFYTAPLPLTPTHLGQSRVARYVREAKFGCGLEAAF